MRLQNNTSGNEGKTTFSEKHLFIAKEGLKKKYLFPSPKLL